MKMISIVIITLVSILQLINAEMRAAWLPVSYQSTSSSEMYDTISQLQRTGVTRVYVDVWNQGTVYFKSPTMSALMAGQNCSSNCGGGDDHLRWAVDAGRELGVEVFAWFEYGLMAAYGSINNDFARYADKNGWILGNYNNFLWLDPASDDVVSFLSGLLQDAALGYGIEAGGLRGVQLDDHFAAPTALTGSDLNVMDEAMKSIREDWNAATGEQGMQLSLSPNPLDTSVASYNVDWNQWAAWGLYDEVVPQLYRTSFTSFKAVYDGTVAATCPQAQAKWAACGVRVDGSGAPTPWTDVQAMIGYCSAAAGQLSGGRGTAVWYAHGVLDLYATEFSELWSASNTTSA